MTMAAAVRGRGGGLFFRRVEVYWEVDEFRVTLDESLEALFLKELQAILLPQQWGR